VSLLEYSLVGVVIFGACVLGTIALYTARLKRKPVTVAFGQLWRKVAERVSQTRKLGRLENPIGLVMQLLVLALIGLAAAHPRFVFQTQTPRSVVLVIDNSASMAARSGLSSRFAEARTRALAAVDQLSDADTIAVVTTGGEVRLARNFARSKRLVRETLQALDIVEGPGKLATGVRSAADLLSSQPKRGKLSPSLIWAVTDGQEPMPAPAELDPKLTITVEQIGDKKPLDNVAITAFDVRDQSGAPGRYEAFVEVQNLSTKKAKGTVRISVDG
jgi:Ca-activated chloride channel homolog